MAPDDERDNQLVVLAHWVVVLAVISMIGTALHLADRSESIGQNPYGLRTKPHPSTPPIFVIVRVLGLLHRSLQCLLRALAPGKLLWRYQAAPSNLTRALTANLPSWLVPRGRALLLAAYVAFTAALMTLRSTPEDGSTGLGRLGFRAGWVATAQLPLVLLLSMRASPLGPMLRRDHLALNFHHRWVARVMFAVSTAHAVLFLAKWAREGVLADRLLGVRKMRWGAAAWLLLAWTGTAACGPLRRASREFFELHHRACAVLFVAFLWRHGRDGVTRDLALGSALVLALDAAVRLVNLAQRNLDVSWLPGPSSKGGGIAGGCPKGCQGPASLAFGYAATVTAVDDELLAVTVRGTSFAWTPGQYIYIWTPTLWAQSPHPFTIAGGSARCSACGKQNLRLILKIKAGFTEQLAAQRLEFPTGDIRVLLLGPHGEPPLWRSFQNLILISSSSGLAYTLPVLQRTASGLDRSEGPLKTSARTPRNVSALMILRRQVQAERLLQQSLSSLNTSRDPGVNVEVNVVVTAPGKQYREKEGYDAIAGGLLHQPGHAVLDDMRLEQLASRLERSMGDSDEARRESPEEATVASPATMSSGVSSIPDFADLRELAADEEAKVGSRLDLDASDGRAFWRVQQTYGRPEVSHYVRDAVEASVGRTLVVVCGGTSLTDAVKEAVARLPREMVCSKDGSSRVRVHFESPACA